MLDVSILAIHTLCMLNVAPELLLTRLTLAQLADLIVAVEDATLAECAMPYVELDDNDAPTWIPTLRATLRCAGV